MKLSSRFLLAFLSFSFHYCSSNGGFFNILTGFNHFLDHFEYEQPTKIVTVTSNRIDLAAGGEIDVSFNAENNQLPSTAFEIFAPQLYKILAKCQLTTPYNDTEHVLWVERERTNDHSSGKAFYGSGSVEEASLFNYMRIQLKSDKGEFKCHVKAVNAPFECGWGRQVLGIFFFLLSTAATG